MAIYNITQIFTYTMQVDAEDEEAALEWWNTHPDDADEDEGDVIVEYDERASESTD